MEKIICSAIWYKELPLVNNDEHLLKMARPVNCEVGIVFSGHRHHNCMYQMIAITGKRSVTSEVGEYVQGFLTNKNMFVNREEGAKIALESGQIEKLNYSNNRLYSEDLY